MTQIADILDRAADLIEPEGAWWPSAESAESNCAQTAIAHVTNFSCDHAAMEFFAAFLGQSPECGYLGQIWSWNDAPERTQAEVVATLRAAATKAREQGR